MPNGPNVSGMVNDPQFQGLPPAQQREALFKLTNDQSFSNLSDGDTFQFVSKMRSAGPVQQAISSIPKPPNPIPQGGGFGGAIATGESVASGVNDFLQKIGPKPEPMPNVTPQQVMAMNPEQRQVFAQQLSQTQAKNAVGSIGLASAFMGAGAGLASIPTKAKAGALLETVAKDANQLPVVASRTGPALARLKELVDAGGVTPRGMGKVLRRVTNISDENPLLYKEARDIYSNVSRLTAEDIMRLPGPVKRQMSLVAQAMRADIGDTAAAAGREAEYYQGLKQYAQAAKLHEFASKALKHFGAGALGVLGAGGAYETYRALK